MSDFEKLGMFYLGRAVDAAGGVTNTPILYDSRDLTTHAVCVGMTGSGKTGLCVGLIEEAAIDGIPVIAIDPKGDLGNLLLAFPELRPEDFRPWIDESRAARAGHSADEEAAAEAARWRKGLADWGQDPSRIATFARAAERTVYTPGSRAGRPVAALASLHAPANGAADAEALHDRVQGIVSGILSLLGIEADPLRSREHILLSTLVSRAFAERRSLDLPSLIREVQKPPVTQVGVMDLEAFYPAAERFALATALNNLLASPGFSVWTEGTPLDVGTFLYGPGGTPRLSIFSIAHLSDTERMFFVTLLLSEILSWTRAQPGTSSLRAIVYMDEVFGYFPPTANPPSKTPMLTLLKQARAYGVGIVLATQNPVDLDYKGLSNAGTWFIGRLQTERDKARVLDGLEGSAGASFDRKELDQILSGLASRVFLLHDTHEDAPVLFHTRWTMSYLAGPMTREQISRLTPEATAPATHGTTPTPTPTPPPTPPAPANVSRPVLPPGIDERFVAGGSGGVLRPALFATCTLHYVSAKLGLDEWQTVHALALLDEETAHAPWEHIRFLSAAPEWIGGPPEGTRFASLPSAASKPSAHTRWKAMLGTVLARQAPHQAWSCASPKLASRPGEREDEFRGRVRDARRAARDAAVEKLRQKAAGQLEALERKLASAEGRVSKEESQLASARTSTAISVGATVLGALLGRKARSVSNVGRASGALRSAGRAREQAEDVRLAKERSEGLRQEIQSLEEATRVELEALRASFDEGEPVIETLVIAPRKQDLSTEPFVLVWVPEGFGPPEQTGNPRGTTPENS